VYLSEDHEGTLYTEIKNVCGCQAGCCEECKPKRTGRILESGEASAIEIDDLLVRQVEAVGERGYGFGYFCNRTVTNTSACSIERSSFTADMTELD
jgi:hypothetical protein